MSDSEAKLRADRAVQKSRRGVVMQAVRCAPIVEDQGVATGNIISWNMSPWRDCNQPSSRECAR